MNLFESNGETSPAKRANQDPRFEPPLISTRPRVDGPGFDTVLRELLADARFLFGVVSNLQPLGVQWLETLFEAQPEMRCRLLVCVYVSCKTRRGDLARLREIESGSEGRVGFRLILWDNEDEASPSNALFYGHADGGRPVLAAASPPGFGLSTSGAPQITFVERLTWSIFEEARRWFDEAWLQGRELSSSTIDIPALVRTPGTPEAQRLWTEYKHLFSDAAATEVDEPERLDTEPNKPERLNAEPNEPERLDAEPTEHVTPVTEQVPAPQCAVTVELGIEPPDGLVERIESLYAKGSLVIIDKLTRIPPLDMPARAEWFGVKSLRNTGAVSREVKYRISVLDETTLKKLETKRKMTTTILSQMSFSLGDGARWIPNQARDAFENALNSADAEARESLIKILAGGADAFVDARIKQIIEDANEMYGEFAHAGEKLAKRVTDEIVMELKARLNKATQGRFLSKVNYSSVTFGGAAESAWSSPWSAALLLLRNVAEFPRKCLTDPRFLQGLKIDPDDLVDVMNVCDDDIVRRYSEKHVRKRAAAELEILKAIVDSRCDHKAKCELIFAVIGGTSHDEMSAQLKAKEPPAEDTASEV